MAHVQRVDRQQVRSFLEGKALQKVVAVPEGRYIVFVPDLQDGQGAIAIPNIKELEARLRGADGFLRAIELEAGPQLVPVDGTNVIVINRVDQYKALAFDAKWRDILKGFGGKISRQMIEIFLTYVRGYAYDAQTNILTFSNNAGFHNDIYNMPVHQLVKRYMHADGASVVAAEALTGYYIKKPLTGRAAFLAGAFSVAVTPDAGDTVQSFETGAMVNIPDDPDLPISFIHPTDIGSCYQSETGHPLTINGTVTGLPVYDVGGG